MKATTKTTTEEALLGVLSMGPMSGYEIKQRIEATIGNFWSESFGQIYPSLTRMCKAGLLSAEESGKAGRKVYTLTAAGRARLEAWLRVMPAARKPRNEMLLKLFFGACGRVNDSWEQVVLTREHYAAELERYGVIERQLERRRGLDPGVPFYLATLRYGMAEARAVMEWADETLRALHEAVVEKTDDGPRAGAQR